MIFQKVTDKCQIDRKRKSVNNKNQTVGDIDMYPSDTVRHYCYRSLKSSLFK